MMSQIKRLIRSFARVIVPNTLLNSLERVRATRPIAKRTCPICSYYGYFGVAGIPPRVDALCPMCGSLERHRLFWLWFSGKRNLRSPVLHFAAERAFSGRLRDSVKEYLTADLYSSADLQLDIEDIQLGTGSQGTVICNHVLEHVDDKKALAELYRILVPAGTLIATVPLIDGWDETYEDATIVGPAMRSLHFGQSDHLRMYGADVRERIKVAGFAIQEEFVGCGSMAAKYGLTRGERIFICRKRG